MSRQGLRNADEARPESPAEMLPALACVMGLYALTNPVKKKNKDSHGEPWAGRRRIGRWNIDPKFVSLSAGKTKDSKNASDR